jgi:hypothetical protein
MSLEADRLPDYYIVEQTHQNLNVIGARSEHVAEHVRAGGGCRNCMFDGGVCEFLAFLLRFGAMPK